MNYLKSFNLFESGNASFNWLIKQNNERYSELIEILQSKLFDDYDIISKTNEDFDDYGNYPEHKFWCYLYSNGKTGVTMPTDIKIEKIFIYNFSSEERDNFEKSLNELRYLIYDIMDKLLVIGFDICMPIDSPSGAVIIDFIIMLK